MKVLALTGGIATGKSTALSFLREFCPSATFFDSDLSVAGLLQNEDVLRELVAVFGEKIRNEDGLDRAYVRSLVFADEKKRRLLEKILHPKVREECLELLQKVARTGASPLFIADVPLLFESGFDFGQEAALVVAVSPETQVKRLKARDGHEDSLIASILAAQMPIMEKVRRAEVVFWNEGSREALAAQVKLFLRFYTSI